MEAILLNYVQTQPRLIQNNPNLEPTAYGRWWPIIQKELSDKIRGSRVDDKANKKTADRVTNEKNTAKDSCTSDK